MHIILEKARKYNKREHSREMLNQFSYNQKLGFWSHKLNNVPLMDESVGFKPRTKKEDIETGEDRKGE